MLEIKILVFMGCATFIECVKEPLIVGGDYAEIEDFPHSAYVGIECFEIRTKKNGYYACGGSIINKRIVLTAGHCFIGCHKQKSKTTVSVGHKHKDKGVMSTVRRWLMHPKFNAKTIANDVALVRVRTEIKFGTNVKRVALMKNPPYYESAQVAGWGDTRVDKEVNDPYLKYLDQQVWRPKACKEVMEDPPKGTLCTTSKNLSSHPYSGDSGSALVVRGYIQIGIVSYGIPEISMSVEVYTDTGCFYKWITKNAKKLYCIK